jgi:hypothetical protein
MKIYCCCCGKQCIDALVPVHDQRTTTLIGAKAGINAQECFCGHCAEDLDENGMFPEEYAFIN